MGDDYVAKTAGQHFQNCYQEDISEGYIRIHYDCTVICSGSLSRDLMEAGIIGWLHNTFVTTVEDQVLLPRAILVVIEDDMIRAADHYKKGTSSILAPWLSWIVNDLHRITTAYKEKMPTKSRKFKYPQFLWVPTVYHDGFTSDNHYREKFNSCLRESVQKIGGMMKILELHSWNRHDLSLCSHGILNAKGNKQFWIAVNDAFQAWDKEIKCTQASYNPKKRTF